MLAVDLVISPGTIIAFFIVLVVFTALAKKSHQKNDD